MASKDNDDASALDRVKRVGLGSGHVEETGARSGEGSVGTSNKAIAPSGRVSATSSLEWNLALRQTDAAVPPFLRPSRSVDFGGDLLDEQHSVRRTGHESEIPCESAPIVAPLEDPRRTQSLGQHAAPATGTGNNQEQKAAIAQILDASLSIAQRPLAADSVTNDDVIQEQQRILDHYKAGSEPHTSSLQPPHSSRGAAPHDDLLPSHPYPLEVYVGPSTEAAAKPRPSTDRSHTDSSYRDRMTRLADGRALLVKGTRRVYKSIAAGEAVLVQCATCGTISQVEPTCQALYCTVCHQVTPMDASLAADGTARSL